MTSRQFGKRLMEWRERRRESQLGLALAADVSQRHISFIESGRAKPSREMIVRLSEVLDIPLRARNELLAAAGFAPLYAERPLADSEMRAALSALERIIAHHEPFPAFVVDRSWGIVLHNAAAARLMSACFDDGAIRALASDGQVNFMHMMFERTQMRPRIRNWNSVATRLLERLRREAGGDDQSPSARLLQELRSLADGAAEAPNHGSFPPTLNLELQLGRASLRLFNMITTFGTPQDVGLQELRIEMSFPSDAETEAFFGRAAAEQGRVLRARSMPIPLSRGAT
jgi:transcriptional regulator with XRE-family HTH domain